MLKKISYKFLYKINNYHKMKIKWLSMKNDIDTDLEITRFK